MLSSILFLNGKIPTHCFKKNEGNFFTVAEISDEQITSSTFLNMLDQISYD